MTFDRCNYRFVGDMCCISRVIGPGKLPVVEVILKSQLRSPAVK